MLSTTPARAAESNDRTVPAERATKPEPQRLNDEELQQLAARDEQPDEKVAGGAMSTQHLTYAVIALAAIVLVLLIK